jgi:hypothetical protein
MTVLHVRTAAMRRDRVGKGPAYDQPGVSTRFSNRSTVA